MTCEYCNDTGIFIAQLDDSKDTGIQKCDHCNKLKTDEEAIKLVIDLIYKSKGIV